MSPSVHFDLEGARALVRRREALSLDLLVHLQEQRELGAKASPLPTLRCCCDPWHPPHHCTPRHASAISTAPLCPAPLFSATVPPAPLSSATAPHHLCSQPLHHPSSPSPPSAAARMSCPAWPHTWSLPPAPHHKACDPGDSPSRARPGGLRGGEAVIVCVLPCSTFGGVRGGGQGCGTEGTGKVHRQSNHSTALVVSLILKAVPLRVS